MQNEKNPKNQQQMRKTVMRDIFLDALLPESMSDEAAYKLVNFFGDLTRTLECIYHAQIQRHHRKVVSEFYYSMSDVIREEPPF
jgi:hypothetical protein